VLTLVFPRGIVREFRVRRRTSIPTPLHGREPLPAPAPTPTPAHLESSS
jgi:hypothetical protein